MTEISHAADKALQASTHWTWAVVVLGFSLLLLALYKLCVKQTIASNGRVDTVIVLPATVTRLAKKRHGFQQTRRWVKQPGVLTTQQKHWFAHLYNGQEIVFGVSLYIVGLMMMSKGCASVLAQVYYARDLTPIALIGAGLAAAAWGVLTVVRRHQRNPFSKHQPGITH